jgi:aspartate/tyrosine/aromatic aminotransferase
MSEANSIQRLVVAGNHKEAEQYARSQGWCQKDWKYCDSKQSAIGYRAFELHKAGQFWKQPFLEDLELLEAQCHNPTGQAPEG